MAAIFTAPHGFTGVHGTDTALIHCIDFRFVANTHAFLREGLKIPHFDLVSIAGASLPLADEGAPKEWRDAEFDLAGLVIKLHGVSQIVIVDHMDCGAYRAVYGSAQGEPAQGEREENLHCRNLRRAREELQQRLSTLRLIRTFLIRTVERDGGSFDEFVEIE